MEKLPDLKQLSHEAKEALIVELWEEIQKLKAALEAASNQNLPPAKTSQNSSTPPSKGFKKNIEPSKMEGVKRQASVGRARKTSVTGTKGSLQVQVELGVIAILRRF